MEFKTIKLLEYNKCFKELKILKKYVFKKKSLWRIQKRYLSFL